MIYCSHKIKNNFLYDKNKNGICHSGTDFFRNFVLDMSLGTFIFKRFSVKHDKCGMKVGTDGVILGAWVKPMNKQKPTMVLDVGTGCGLIAMMMAQRMPDSHIMAIDIDHPSVEQAKENVASSSFSKQITVLEADFNQFAQESCKDKYDIIVSNPPFFQESTHSVSARMDIAKHTGSLSFSQLITGVRLLLADDGQFSVIIPYSAAKSFIGLAAQSNLYLIRRCDIRGSSHKLFKRSALTFSHQITTTDYSKLNIHLNSGDYTDEYKALTSDFYLAF